MWVFSFSFQTEMDPEDSQKLLTTSLDAVLTALKDYTVRESPVVPQAASHSLSLSLPLSLLSLFVGA